MRTEVIGRQIEITDAIREHAEGKVEKLLRHFDQVQQVTFTVTHQEHNAQAPFDVELLIVVEHHDDFVSTAKDADLYAAIDQAVNKGSRQLTDHKEKLRDSHR
ncbi:MAG: ribosome-associated translation inhibitor RaiA [Planctomycetota bacterium]